MGDERDMADTRVTILFDVLNTHVLTQNRTPEHPCQKKQKKKKKRIYCEGLLFFTVLMYGSLLLVLIFCCRSSGASITTLSICSFWVSLCGQPNPPPHHGCPFIREVTPAVVLVTRGREYYSNQGLAVGGGQGCSRSRCPTDCVLNTDALSGGQTDGVGADYAQSQTPPVSLMVLQTPPD